MTELGVTNAVCGTLVILFAIGAGGGITDGAMAAPGDPSAGDRSMPMAVQAQNESVADDPDFVRHRLPGTYDETGDRETVERWLIDQLTADLENGAIHLREGEFEHASESVGPAYLDRLEQYAAVTAETDGESYELPFVDAREEQERITNAVARYNETFVEYEHARAEQDEARAREYARELEMLAETIGKTSGQVREQYEILEAETGADLSTPDAAIEEVNEEIQREQAEIRDAEFMHTEVAVEAEDTDISFLDPLTAEGRLQTVDGEPVANESVQFEIGEGTVQTETDSGGTFDFEYRPVKESVSTDQLEIRYVSDPDSVYLGSTTRIDVSISQVEPSISDLTVTDEAAFGDDLTVDGTLHVDGVPVENTSLKITLGNERIDTVEVTNGSFRTSSTVPVQVSNGQRELVVGYGYNSTADGDVRALATTETSTTTTVRETESDLVVSASPTDRDQDVAVNGTLTTADGKVATGEPVHIRIDQTVVESVPTEDDGSFSTVVDVPESMAEGDVRVGAAYEGTGSNLASSEAVTTASFPVGIDAQLWRSIPTWAWTAAGMVGVLTIMAAIWWYYRYRFRRAGDSRPDPDPPVDKSPVSDPADHGRSSLDSVIGSLLERAGERVANNRPNDAIVDAYSAVRHALSDSNSRETAVTHWEFYRRYRRDRDGTIDGREAKSDVEALRTVTEHYERAVFANTDVSSDDALDVFTRACRLCNHDREKSTPEPDRSDDD